MDWDSRRASIFEDDVAQLPHYEARKVRVAQIENGKLKSWECDPKNEEKEMKDWLEIIIRQRQISGTSGVYIIFAGEDPVLHKQKKNPGEKIQGLDSDLLFEFPFSLPTFEEICKTFYVNTSMIRAISRPVATFSRTYFEHDELKGTELISYNIMTHSTNPSSDLAMSVTTNPSAKQTYVILYGCTPHDTDQYLSRLRQCGSAYEHPLLVPGIFAELQRIKHKDAVTINIARLHEYVMNLGRNTLPKGHRGVNAASDAIELWEMVSSDQVVMETWKGMLGRMVDAVGELEEGFYGVEKELWVRKVRDEMCSREGRRIKERLDEIVGVYDELGRKCGRMIEGTSLANSTVWSRMAQRDSKQMKSIALLTMVFLPASFVATFFAMPIFQWRPKDGEKVVSTYIWIYVVATIVITPIVVLLWWWFSRNPPRRVGDEENPDGNQQGAVHDNNFVVRTPPVTPPSQGNGISKKAIKSN